MSSTSVAITTPLLSTTDNPSLLHSDHISFGSLAHPGGLGLSLLQRNIHLRQICQLSMPVSANDNPSSREALSGPDADPWLEAHEYEFQQLHKFKTMEPLPAGAPKPTVPIIHSHFVNKIKRDERGNVSKFRSRLVANPKAEQIARAFSSEPLESNFAPTVRASTVKLIFAIGAALRLEFFGGDVPSAYLYGTLQEPKYMYVPDIFDAYGHSVKWHFDRRDCLFCQDSIPHSPTACPAALSASGGDLTYIHKLIKIQVEAKRILLKAKFKGIKHSLWKVPGGLYGLEESGAIFHTYIKGILLECGFQQSKHDPCLFFFVIELIIIVMHVDDLLMIAEKGSKKAKEISDFLESKFEGFKFAPSPSQYVGLCIEYNDDQSITLSQPAYCIKAGETVGIKSDREDKKGGIKVPMPPIRYAPNGPVTQSPDDNILSYQQRQGLAGYAAHLTRLDIQFANAYTAQFAARPYAAYSAIQKQILGYLVDNHSIGLRFHPDLDVSRMYVFSDASYMSSEEGHSHSGGILTIGSPANGAVMAISVRQRNVARSTCQAEFNAVDAFLPETMFHRNLMVEVGFNMRPVILFQDNQSTIRWLDPRSPPLLQRVRHFAMRYHFVREQLSTGDYILVYCPTKLMLADILTKPMDERTHNFLRDIAMGHRYPEYHGILMELLKDLNMDL
jgi:hypothetical protein